MLLQKTQYHKSAQKMNDISKIQFIVNNIIFQFIGLCNFSMLCLIIIFFFLCKLKSYNQYLFSERSQI